MARARLNRRRLLGLAAGLMALPAASGARAGARAGPRQTAPVVQPLQRGDGTYLARALALRDQAVAAGDQPYGALVVKDGLIVGEAPSRVVSASDPTAHAELEAIRDAARRQGVAALAGATLYSSSPPCPMCEAAAYWAGIARLVNGKTQLGDGVPRLRRC